MMASDPDPEALTLLDPANLAREDAQRPQRNSNPSGEGELFHLMVENITDYAIFSLDQDGCILSWSLGAERVLGYTETEILGKSIACFFTPEDLLNGEPDHERKRALKTGRGEDDRWHVRKDGTRVWCTGVLTPLWDQSTKLRGFAKIMRDRTELKRKDEAFRDAQSYAESIVETVREPLLVLDADLRVRTANRSFYRVFQVEREDTENHLLFELGDGQWDSSSRYSC